MLWLTWREAFENLRQGPILEEIGHAVHRSRLWRIGEHMASARLRRLDDDVLLDSDQLMGDVADRAAPLFLGHYSVDGVEYALTRYGLWGRLLERPSGPPRVEITGVGESVQTMRILEGPDGDSLVELRAGLVSGDQKTEALPRTDQPWLNVEWLCLQDPQASFTERRPQLPGQDHPGLREGREVAELLLIMGWRLGCAGLLAHPAWFHNAVMYRIHFRFLDPAEEGQMRALLRAWRASGLRLGGFSQAVEAGRVVDAQGAPLKWAPGVVVAPLMAEAEFQDDAWERVAKKGSEAHFEVLPSAR